MDTRFNDLVKNTANAIAVGASPEDIAPGLVAQVGGEDAFLIFCAAKAYLALPEPVFTPSDDPEVLP